MRVLPHDTLVFLYSFHLAYSWSMVFDFLSLVHRFFSKAALPLCCVYRTSQSHLDALPDRLLTFANRALAKFDPNYLGFL